MAEKSCYASLSWLVFQLAAAGIPKFRIADHLGLNRKTVDIWLKPSLAEKAREASRRSHRNNLQARKQKQREYRAANVEAIKAKNRTYQQNNKDRLRVLAQNWRELNRETLKQQAKTYYNGDKLHSFIDPATAIILRCLYEQGESASALSAHLGVGNKAVLGAVRWAGGTVRSKTVQSPLGDSLSSYVCGHATRRHDTPVIFYLNATSVAGAYKGGITCESWQNRAAKNRCGHVVYGPLIGTWRLPSRFHGWCVEACWLQQKKVSPKVADVFKELAGRTEIRAGDPVELAARVDGWCRPFDGADDTLQSRLECAAMALAHQPQRSALARRLKRWIAEQLP